MNVPYYCVAVDVGTKKYGPGYNYKAIFDTREEAEDYVHMFKKEQPRLKLSVKFRSPWCGTVNMDRVAHR